MNRALVFAFVIGVALTCAAAGPKSTQADGQGELTLPLQIAPQENSWFDHNSPGLRPQGNLPFIRWDGYSDISTNAMCIQNPDGSFFCPCTSGSNCYNGHEGIDFDTQASALPVIAAARGTVDGVPVNVDGFGLTVKVSHSQLGINTRYSHLSSSAVSNGQFVQRGQLLGYAGNTGNVTGVHLHFGVYNASSGGTFIDPYGWAYPNYTSPDPYGDIGNLWATRLGTFTSGGIAAKQGQLSAGFDGNLGLPGSGNVTAMSMDGSRVGIVRGASHMRRMEASTNMQ